MNYFDGTDANEYDYYCVIPPGWDNVQMNMVAGVTSHDTPPTGHVIAWQHGKSQGYMALVDAATGDSMPCHKCAAPSCSYTTSRRGAHGAQVSISAICDRCRRAMFNVVLTAQKAHSDPSDATRAAAELAKRRLRFTLLDGGKP